MQQNRLLNANQHQILEQLAALSFNASDAGQGIQRGGHGGGRGYIPAMYPPYQQGYGGCGRGCRRGCGRRTQQQYSPGGFPTTPGMGGVFPPTYAMPPPAGGGGGMYTLPPQGGAHQDTHPKVDNNSKSAPLTPILSNVLQIGMRATRVVLTFLTATPAQLARPTAKWAMT